MSELLPQPEMLVAFVGASLILAVTPGPSVAYIVVRSATQGRRSGLASVAGIAVGGWFNAIGASIGLAAVFAVSALAFTVVKWAGAVYLIFLGVQIIRRPITPRREQEGRRASPKGIFRDGFAVALLNPKTTVFFAAFLPQFITSHSSPTLQALFLSTVCIAIAAVTDSVYAVVASSASAWLSNSFLATRGGRLLNGGVFIGLGVYSAVGGDRGSN
jgi:threonine/homoserine/homoserine lactone efflux protein